MALSLSSERSRPAALPFQPVAAMMRWAVKARTAHVRRIALRALLELDHARLDDLGISRTDLSSAIHGAGLGGLNAARARNSRR